MRTEKSGDETRTVKAARTFSNDLIPAPATLNSTTKNSAFPLVYELKF